MTVAQRIPIVLALAALLNCDDVGEPERHHDFADDTTGAEVEWPSGTTALPPASVDTPPETPSEVTPSDPETMSETIPDESEASEGDASDDPPLDMHVDPPQACDGEVPEACLEDLTDASHCTEGTACEKSACTQRSFAGGRMALMRCLERECGVEPAYDLDCVESWADLEEACLLGHCGLAGNPCAYMALWGWQAECLR